MQHNKVDIGQFPTPISKENDLAESELEGKVNLYVKHEGRNNDAIGVGVKIRQVEYLLGAALQNKYMHLIVDGVIDSHCCRAISHYAPKYGLEAVLVIKDDEPIGNIPEAHQRMIDSGARIVYVGKNPEPERLEAIKKEIAAKYWLLGAKPMLVPTGATNELTIPAGMDISEEIAKYEQIESIKFDYVVLPVGTGGIYFGLEIGRRKKGKRWEVIGLIIDDNMPEYYQQRFRDIGNRFAEMSGLDRALLKKPLLLYEQRGKGYSIFEQEDLTDIERIENYGIYFDPVYMYKCFQGLKQLIKTGQIQLNTNVLLIQTANK